MQKLPCNDCGALILPTTAESTGGVCMACKQGIRQAIERSRAYYKARAQYDPAEALWKSLVKRSSEDPLLTTLSDAERTYFTVCLLDGEVYNGGFDQFFSNSSGAYYAEAASGLAELGALNALKILWEAAETIFGNDAPPKDRAKRWEMMKQRQGQQPNRESSLDALDEEYWHDPDDLGDRLQAYADRTGLVERFKQ